MTLCKLCGGMLAPTKVVALRDYYECRRCKLQWAFGPVIKQSKEVSTDSKEVKRPTGSIEIYDPKAIKRPIGFI